MTNTSRKPASKLRRFTVALGVLPLAISTRAHAQTNGGPLVLRLPSSARFAAMGNAGLTGTDGDALLYNAGMLAVSRGAAISVQRYGRNAHAGAFGSTTVSGSFTYGLGVQFLDWRAPQLPYRDVAQHGGSHLGDDGTVQSSSLAITAGVGRVYKGLRLGANAKYAQENFGAQLGRAVAFDVGVSKSMGPGTITVMAQNIGPEMELTSVPTILPRRVGIGYGGGMVPINEYLDLGLQVQVTAEGEGWYVRPAVGVELGYVPIEGVALVVRTGVRRAYEVDESMFTAGLGLNVDRISLDYAYEPFEGRSASHRVGFRVR